MNSVKTLTKFEYRNVEVLQWKSRVKNIILYPQIIKLFSKN